jgi:membrane protease YdiL (CAAX protease family)
LQSVHPVVWGLVVSGLAAALGRLLPDAWAGTAVAALFLGATYLLALGPDQSPADSGLSLGGLFERVPLDPTRVMRRALRAAFVGALALLIVAPAYTLGFVFWHQPTVPFDLHRALFLTESGLPSAAFLDLAFGHLLVVALPEEAFFRGYLQSALDERMPPRVTLGGARLGPALLISSAIFALGHWLSVPDVGRFAVFFPSLLFGWLRAKTGGIGASVVCHALCNVYVIVLGAGFGLRLG